MESKEKKTTHSDKEKAENLLSDYFKIIKQKEIYQ